MESHKDIQREMRRNYTMAGRASAARLSNLAARYQDYADELLQRIRPDVWIVRDPLARPQRERT